MRPSRAPVPTRMTHHYHKINFHHFHPYPTLPFPSSERSSLAVNSSHLSTRVHALKTVGALVPFLDEASIAKFLIPTLRVVRERDHTPAVTMCALGCYDLVAKKLSVGGLARHVLPGIIPLLDEKALNAKQFEMVVGRVQSMMDQVGVLSTVLYTNCTGVLSTVLYTW